MEKKYIHPDSFRAQFRSKKDLIKRLGVDLDIYLPSYRTCPVKFMKQIISGEKKFLKNEKVVHFEVPDYPELSVKEVWPMVKENPDLLRYFPDYTPSQKPEKEFLYGILSTIMTQEVRQLIFHSTKQRSLDDKEDLDQMVEVREDLAAEIQSLLMMETTKGRANHLLKKGSILDSRRKPQKRYNVDLSQILSYGVREEREEEQERHEENKDTDSLKIIQR